MFDHGGKGERDDGENSCPEQTAVNAIAEETEDRAVPVDGKAEPLCLADGGCNGSAGSRIYDDGEHVGDKNTQKDRNDLGHSLTPHVEADDDNNSHDSNQPAGFTVCNRGRGKR